MTRKIQVVIKGDVGPFEDQTDAAMQEIAGDTVEGDGSGHALPEINQGEAEDSPKPAGEAEQSESH